MTLFTPIPVEPIQSPEQIAGRIGIDKPGLKTNYESIYQFIYRHKRRYIKRHVKNIVFLNKGFY